MDKRKFQLQNLTVNIEFKDPFCFRMTILDNLNGDSFINDQAQLVKIKKDMVIAALSRQNEMSLKTQFYYVDIEPKKLIVTFTVTLKHLPTFSETVMLDQVENKERELNKIQSAQIRNQIEELQKKIIESNSTKSTFFYDLKACRLNPICNIHQVELKKGNYFIELSGFCRNYRGQGLEGDLIFIFQVGDDRWESAACTFLKRQISYPYILRKQITLTANGTLKINAEVKRTAQAILDSITLTISSVSTVK